MDEAYRIAQDRGVTGCLHGGQGAARGARRPVHRRGPASPANNTSPVAVVGAVPCAAGDRRGELLQVMLRDPSTGVRAADVARTVATRGCGPARAGRSNTTPCPQCCEAGNFGGRPVNSTTSSVASTRLRTWLGPSRAEPTPPAEAWGGVTRSSGGAEPRSHPADVGWLGMRCALLLTWMRVRLPAYAWNV